MNTSKFLHYSFLLFLTFICLDQLYAQSQIVFSKNVNSNAYVENIWPTADGGYIAGGTYERWDANINAVNYDHYILKTDSLGNTLWEKIYDFTQNDGKCVNGSVIRELNDGGYAYISSVYCGQNGAPQQSKYKLLRLNSLGDTLWTNTYERGLRSMGQWVEPTNDDGFIMTGYAAEVFSSADVYVVWADTFGVELLNRKYELDHEEQATCIRQTSDGGFILVGGTSNQNLYPRAKTWLLKLTARGDTQWTKTFPWGMWQINAFVEETSDSGYIVSVRDSGKYQRVIKTNSVGIVEWTKDFGDGNGCVTQTSNNEFAVFGKNYFTKTDSGGMIITNKNTDFSPIFWRFTPDNGFITTTGDKIIKTDCQANYTFWDKASCPTIIIQDTSKNDTTYSSVRSNHQKESWRIYPNPTEGNFTVFGYGMKQIEVYEITGKFLLNKKISAYSISIDLSDYKKGLYLVRIVNDYGTSVQKLIVR